MPIIPKSDALGKLPPAIKPKTRSTTAKSSAGATPRPPGGRVSHDSSKGSGVGAAGSGKTPSAAVGSVPQGTRKGRGQGNSWNSPSSHDFSRRFKV